MFCGSAEMSGIQFVIEFGLAHKIVETDLFCFDRKIKLAELVSSVGFASAAVT